MTQKEEVHVLIIEDGPELAEEARREIEEAFEGSDRIAVRVETERDFHKGLARVRDQRTDVVVLDVLCQTSSPPVAQEPVGQDVFAEIKKACFTPVVFWTAVPDEVYDDATPPLVTVVAKDDTADLPKAVQEAVESQALTIIRGIEQGAAEVLRKHMWEELAPNWDEYTRDTDSKAVAQVLLSRLARTLEEQRDQTLTAHPSYRYLYPPASERWSPGDLLQERNDRTWWAVLTPACDFEHDKVDYVLLAQASPLEDHQKYKKWSDSSARSSSEKDRWRALSQDVLRATRGRYHFLPAFRDIPNLVIDLDKVTTVEPGDLARFTRVASLISPFAEALLIQYSQVRGRIGVPDLDLDLIKRRLLADPPASNNQPRPGR